MTAGIPNFFTVRLTGNQLRVAVERKPGSSAVSGGLQKVLRFSLFAECLISEVRGPNETR